MTAKAISLSPGTEYIASTFTKLQKGFENWIH